MEPRIACIDALAGLGQLDDDSVAVIVTSPPYNVGYNRARGGRNPKPGRWKADYAGFDDMLPPDGYVAYHRACLHEMLRVLRPDGLLWYVYGRRPDVDASGPETALLSRVLSSMPVRQEIIWHKAGGGIFNLPTGGKPDGGVLYAANTHESIFLMAKSKDAKMTRQIAKLGSVWALPKEAVTGHPAVFPVALAERCIIGTEAEGLVVDPFVGSGTTLIAAQALGRDSVGFELVAKTAVLAERRIREQTARLMA